MMDTDKNVSLYLIKQSIRGIFYIDEEPQIIARGLTILAENKIRISRDLLYQAVNTKDDDLYMDFIFANHVKG